jgi:DNA-binding MarR family transcriptional regulator
MLKEELIQSIVENLVKLQRPSPNIWKGFDLSHAQVGMLFLLSYHQHSSVNETADYLGISKSAISQLADPLVQKGFISRDNDPKDRRIVRLSLTVKGRQMLKKLAKHKYDRVRAAIEQLDDNDVAKLYELHQKMMSKLSKKAE